MTDTINDVIGDLQQYVVAPLAAFGIGGFVFDCEGEAIAQLHADITDHYTENNLAVQDHIAIKPKRITLKGYVGEVVYNGSSDNSQIIQKAVQKLTTISAFLPQLSAAATQLQNAYESPLPADLTITDASDIYGIVKNVISSQGNEARQQNAYLYFKALMTSKTIMGIQTPWEFMTNMAIESITAIQSENSIYISDFSITLKEMRFAQTKLVAYNGTASGQPQANNNAGVVVGSSRGVNTSLETDALSEQSNVAALALARGGNAVPPIDKVLSGVSALQGQDPVNIGNVSGVALPTTSLPGSQSLIVNASDLMAQQNIKNTFIPIPIAGQ